MLYVYFYGKGAFKIHLEGLILSSVADADQLECKERNDCDMQQELPFIVSMLDYHQITVKIEYRKLMSDEEVNKDLTILIRGLTYLTFS